MITHRMMKPLQSYKKSLTLTLLPLYWFFNLFGLTSQPTCKVYLVTFSDSSWNDDVDHGRSTGCFLIVLMCVVVDHSPNLPDPVALSSAEREYNKCCVAGMTTTHMNMFLHDLLLFLDNNYAIAIDTSLKDAKHNWRILCHYHCGHENVEER